MDAFFAVYEPILDSQAGRRGFDPRLPLHKINNLQAPAKLTYLD
jgi:hypothetical protein